MSRDYMELEEVLEILAAIKEVGASRRINNAKYPTVGAAIDALIADLSFEPDVPTLDDEFDTVDVEADIMARDEKSQFNFIPLGGDKNGGT